MFITRLFFCGFFPKQPFLSSGLDPDPSPMASDDMPRLLHTKLAVMAQAVQFAQLAQQVAQARIGGHAGAVLRQPVAQHLRLARRG